MAMHHNQQSMSLKGVKEQSPYQMWNRWLELLRCDTQQLLQKAFVLWYGAKDNMPCMRTTSAYHAQQAAAEAELFCNLLLLLGL